MNEEGFFDSFLWEDQLWEFSNSVNKSSGTGSEEKSAAACEELPAVAAKEAEAAAVAPVKKRGRGRGKGNDGEDNKKAIEGESTNGHDTHIWTERERRKKMKNMFASLQALLPQLPSKADKSTIVDEAVNYIKTLEEELEKLEKQKQEKQQSTTTVCYDPSTLIFNPQQQKPTTTTLMTNSPSREEFLADQGSSSNLLLANNNSNNNNSSNLSLLVSQQKPLHFRTWTTLNLVLNICGDEAQINICSNKKPGLFTRICQVLEKFNIEVVSAHVSSDSNRSLYMIHTHARRGSNLLKPVIEIYSKAASEISSLFDNIKTMN